MLSEVIANYDSELWKRCSEYYASNEYHGIHIYILFSTHALIIFKFNNVGAVIGSVGVRVDDTLGREVGIRVA